MWQLNLPSSQFNIKKNNENYFIFDKYRKKYVKLNPEEWVRQNFLNFIIQNMNYPESRIVVEQQILINGMKKRCDAVYYNENLIPEIIFEFKSPQVKLNEAVIDQLLTYNYQLKVQYFIISNGIDHFFCMKDVFQKKIKIMQSIPEYSAFQKLIGQI